MVPHGSSGSTNAPCVNNSMAPLYTLDRYGVQHSQLHSVGQVASFMGQMGCHMNGPNLSSNCGTTQQAACCKTPYRRNVCRWGFSTPPKLDIACHQYAMLHSVIRIRGICRLKLTKGPCPPHHHIAPLPVACVGSG